MPDPSGPDDGLAATREGHPSTLADGVESTEADRYDTALPSEIREPPAGAPASDATIEDTYSTRYAEHATDGVGEATELDPYATALPERMQKADAGAPASDATIEDTYSTRFTDLPSGVSAGAVSDGWSGSGGQPSTAAGVTFTRFHPLRLHARGGLGEVFVALDGELNREVALKEIQQKHIDKQESQFRFVFEAEVTGGLEHPGIVPVYGLGRHPDGRPYYAMRFIRGDSLKGAIKKFHEPGEDKGKLDASSRDLGHSLEFRQLVARFVSVCHAIDYAHGRGVLHRDIKPDNIMLGNHGETLVVDWGLAKALDRPDPTEPSALKPLRPLSGSDTSATLAGSVMGTPAFMSPEQAAGEVNELGPASDIFSLGSTLYALMTGQAPFRDKGLSELLEHVRNAEFPPPRVLNRAIPPALEAIALKAMALRPVDRYPTAAALADDLERWLADEPVLAYPEPWTTRFARWARRHRTSVAVAFALLLTASTTLGISAVLINREKVRAERNHQRARSAVEQMLTRVGEVDLADIPQMESVRRDLLDRALAFYRDVLAERRTDSSSRVETGRALARLGDIREMLGQYVEAEKNYQEALVLLDAPDVPRDLEALLATARARTNLGILLKKSNRFVEAEPNFRFALLELKGLAAEYPNTPEIARAASATLYQLGTLLARLDKRTDEDEASYRQAIREQRALASKPSSRPEDRREVARYLNNLGILQSRSDPVEAEKTFLEAWKIQEELQATSATNASFRWQRARTWNNLANLYVRERLSQQAAEAFAQARAGFESLASDFPKVPDYRRELAMMLNNLALFLEANPSGDVNPLGLLRQAEADQQRLVEEFPEVPDHRMKLAITRLHLGDLLRATDLAGSEAALAGAVDLQEKLVAPYPQVPEYQAALGRTLTELARSKAVGGRQAESLELLKPAIAAIKRAIDANPRDQNNVRSLFDARDDRCRVLVKLRRHADLALEAGLLAEITPSRPQAPLAAAGFLARCFEMAGADATLDQSSRQTLQETYARDTIKNLREALKRGDPDPAFIDGPDFKPFKGRPDFEKLREDWLAKGRKAVG